MSSLCISSSKLSSQLFVHCRYTAVDVLIRSSFEKKLQLRLWSQAWAQFCCKMLGESLVCNQYSNQVDAEVKFYKYRFPIVFFTGVLKAIVITLCIILTDDFQINILKFVSGHGHTVLLFSNVTSIQALTNVHHGHIQGHMLLKVEVTNLAIRNVNIQD